MVNHSDRLGWKAKKESAYFYSEIAKSYQELYIEEQSAKYDIALKTLQTPLLGIVLDVGCGQGEFLQRISGNVILGVGIDISLGMLGEAKNVTESVIDFICADADYLPFRERVFDSAFSFTLLQNMPDPSFTLCEMLRVTQTNALVVVSFPLYAKPFEETDIWFKGTNRLWARIDSNTQTKEHIFFCGRTSTEDTKNQPK